MNQKILKIRKEIDNLDDDYEVEESAFAGLNETE